MIEFADSVLGDDAARLKRAREALRRDLGEAALVDAAGIVGFFNAIDRVADATGTQLDEETAADTEGMRAELGIDTFNATKLALT